MTEFETVFEIALGQSEILTDAFFRVVGGVVVLALWLGLLVLYIYRRNTDKRRPKVFALIFLPAWAVIWISSSYSWFSSANRELDSLVSAYQIGAYEVAEGPVQVLRTQPKSGHAPGDLVSVGDTQFEINYFKSTHAYHKTLAYGGHLREGVYAKVFHDNGRILRIDVKGNP